MPLRAPSEYDRADVSGSLYSSIETEFVVETGNGQSIPLGGFVPITHSNHDSDTSSVSGSASASPRTIMVGDDDDPLHRHNYRKGRTFINTVDHNGRPLRFHRGVFDPSRADPDTTVGGKRVDIMGYVIWNGVPNGSRDNRIDPCDHHSYPKAVRVIGDGAWWLECSLGGPHFPCSYHSRGPPVRAKDAITKTRAATKRARPHDTKSKKDSNHKYTIKTKRRRARENKSFGNDYVMYDEGEQLAQNAAENAVTMDIATPSCSEEEASRERIPSFRSVFTNMKSSGTKAPFSPQLGVLPSLAASVAVEVKPRAAPVVVPPLVIPELVEHCILPLPSLSCPSTPRSGAAARRLLATPPCLPSLFRNNPKPQGAIPEQPTAADPTTKPATQESPRSAASANSVKFVALLLAAEEELVIV